MNSNQAVKKKSMVYEESYWKINYIVTTEYIILDWDEHPIYKIQCFNTKLFGKCSQIPVWQLCDTVKFLT